MNQNHETKAKLLEQIVSYNYKVRGEKGEWVKIISRHDNVYIVENSKGNRYSVNQTKIKIYDGD